MGTKAGFGLKALQWLIRAVQFLCAALILGVFSYFLAALNNHNLRISTSVRAVEGISGAAVLYTLIALILLCCVAGLAFFSFIAIILDLCFIGAFIYVAYANRHGASSCRGYLNTPFGQGNADQTTTAGSGGFTALPSFRTACKLQTACLAVAIVAIVFFLLSILVELFLVRNHRKEKRFGPSPANNYTHGSGYAQDPYDEKAGLFGRFRRQKKGAAVPVADSTLPAHTTPAELDNRGLDNRGLDNRGSYNTDTTAIGEGLDHHKLEQGTAGTACPAHTYGVTGADAAPARAYGGRSTIGEPAAPPQGYRYDDGVY